MSRVVLLVDDEPMVRDVVSSMLEDLGCEVVTAETATDALARLADNNAIELLVTDINMPGMGGYELAEKAKRVRRGLKIILLTGRDVRNCGFPVIQKPFLREDLERMLERTAGTC
jgi:two-component system, cell cycle response regulator CpdR